jgi:hypothetical protein
MNSKHLSAPVIELAIDGPCTSLSPQVELYVLPGMAVYV